MATMASRSAADEATSSAQNGSEQHPGTTSNETRTTATAVAPTSRSDNFAAISSKATSTPTPAGGSGRGSKLAAMTASSHAQVAASEEEKVKAEAQAREVALQGIKEKLSKRKQILANLDKAENLTCKLLEVAHETTRALEDLSGAPNISELSKTYRDTLRELHPLLSTDTETLIRPYQNHSNETKQSMYAARVDMRLAKERAQVLKVMTELEKNHHDGNTQSSESLPSASDSKKRQREEK